MSNEENYIQCVLRRGRAVTTGWVPERGARLGAEIELLPGGKFWNVAKVFDNVVMPKSQLTKHQRDHRGSLPSVERMV